MKKILYTHVLMLLTLFSSCDYVGMFKSTFSFVKWEDEEAYSIDSILSNCEVIEDGNLD